MAAPKSNEGKAAKKIVDTMNQRGLNNNMVAYFIGQYATKEVMHEILDLFLHVVKDINDSPIPEHFTMDDAANRLLADSIVRAVKDAGRSFN